MVCEMGGKWPLSCGSYQVFFFSGRFVRVHGVQSYSNTYMATAWKKSRFIWSERSDFHIVDNLSMAVHALLILMLTFLSVDEILLQRSYLTVDLMSFTCCSENNSYFMLKYGFVAETSFPGYQDLLTLPDFVGFLWKCKKAEWKCNFLESNVMRGWVNGPFRRLYKKF